jgi:aarF domain-containing kinase
MQTWRIHFLLSRKGLVRRPGAFDGARWNSTQFHPRSHRNPWVVYPTILLVASGTAWFAYKPIRHSVLAGLRCYRVVEAACLGVIDYKTTFAQLSKNPSEDDRFRCVVQVPPSAFSHLLHAGPFLNATRALRIAF